MINYFIKKSVVTICLNLSILLIGFFSLSEISSEFIPAIEVPAVGVVFPTTVLSHQRVISELIEPVEKKLLATGYVDKIETALDKDKTILFIFYNWKLKPEECLQRARQVVSSMKRPEGILEPIFVLHRPTLSPIFRVAFYGSSLSELSSQLKSFSSRLERTPGVAGIQLRGASERRATIQLDPVAASKNKVKLQNIFSTAIEKWSFRHLINNVKDQNQNVRQVLRYKLENFEDVKNLSVYNGEGNLTPLRHIAKIQLTQTEPSVYIDKAQPALILEVIKAPGSDALEIVDRVKDQIKTLKKKKPQIKSNIIYDESEKIKQAQGGVFQNFAIGVALNSIILIIFLGSIIGAIVASCVFPTAILGTLYIMKSADISLNIFALNGFSLASGMITDASIVVLESIMQRFQKGQELVKSCDRGTRDVMLGVFASTLTTAAVIVPISIQTGVSSKLFSDLGIVLVTTQFISLIAVFSFVPWLCSKILKKDEKRMAPVDFLYSKSVILVNNMVSFAHRCLDLSSKNVKFKWAVPLVATLLSLIALNFLPNSELLPNVASNTYSLSIPIKRIKLMSSGSEFQKKLSLNLGEFNEVLWAVTSKDEDTVKAIFETKNKEVVKKISVKISKDLDIPISKIFAIPLGPTPPTEPMSYDGYYYISDSIPKMIRETLIEKFCNYKGILDCVDETHYEEPSLVLKPQPLNMIRSKTNILESTLNIASLTKKIDLNSLANLTLPFPLYIESKMSPIEFPMLKGKMEQLKTAAFNSVFSKKVSKNQNSKFRKNGQNFYPIYFRLSGITIGQAVSKIQEIAKEMKIKEGLIKPMGTIETMNETFGKMINALIIAMVLILLVLVFQFQSISQALVIMYSMPLSLGGAIFGLVIMNETLNVGVIVGFVLLIGIIVNNGILLMDAINQRITVGMDKFLAVKEAVETRTRPILMTTFSTVFGMLPTIVLEAEGKELYQGMAIVNIFGMLFGTILTLVVTPIVINMVINRKPKKVEV